LPDAPNSTKLIRHERGHARAVAAYGVAVQHFFAIAELRSELIS
jgi:hypothetical protein